VTKKSAKCNKGKIKSGRSDGEKFFQSQKPPKKQGVYAAEHKKIT